MKFVDANDGSPISDAHVLFRAKAYRSNVFENVDPTILFLTEGVTDAAGRISFPAQRFWPYPYLFTNHGRPTMFVFKPGYELTVVSSGPTFPNPEDLEKWDDNNAVIKMRAATSDEEFYHAVWWSVWFAEESYQSERDACLWKKIPGFLKATNQAVANFGEKRLASMAHQEPLGPVTGPVQKLISKEDFYVQQGCGSPRLFFESYVAP